MLLFIYTLSLKSLSVGVPGLLWKVFHVTSTLLPCYYMFLYFELNDAMCAVMVLIPSPLL